jgi:hypothetical protein
MVSGAVIDQESCRLSKSRRYFGHAAASLVLLLAPSATAAPNGLPEQVELRFTGGAGCPSQAAFVHEVAARVRRPIEWVSAEASTQISVTVTQSQGHATGTLQVVTGGAEPTLREFVAGNCGEISSALALVTALTLDPNARTEALPPPSEEPVPAPTPVEEPAPAPEPEPVPAPTPLPPRAATPPRPTPPAQPTPYVAWLGPVAGVDSGYAPGPLITFGVSLGARAAVTQRLSPSLQLTPLWGKTGSTGPSASGGTFAWAMARLEACPTSFALTEWLSFDPCLSGELGRLVATAKASETVVPVTAERWWAAGGVALALHASRGRWFARLELRGLLPATRDTFVLRDPDLRVHQPSSPLLGTSLGFGAQFGP